jgi:serine/threonine-protein kinase
MTFGTGDALSVYDLARGVSSQLARNAGVAIWHPAGDRIAFASSASGGPRNLSWISVDGSSQGDRLTTSNRSQVPSSWSPDRKTLAFVQEAGGANFDIWLLSVGDGPAAAHPFLATSSIEQWPEFSPDGRWLAYGSDESGRHEVYVRAYPGPGLKEKVSVNGGTQPAWAANGRELFYTEPAPDGALTKMMAVPVTQGERFTAGRPQMVFEGRYPTFNLVRGYDVTHDANRFLMHRISGDSEVPPITQIVVVANWQEELKRLVPAN